MAETIAGDEHSIQCPCGSEHLFECADGQPDEGDEVECECGRVLKVLTVHWSALVRAEVVEGGEEWPPETPGA